MTTVNVLEAKTSLSKLLRMLESGEEDVVVIARNGTPVADLRLTATAAAPAYLGIAEGAYAIPDDIDTCNDEIAGLFGAHGDS